MPVAGTLIGGKYRILSKLKDGGMGTIYKVHHDLLDEVRVIKVVRPASGNDAELQRRFAREAKLFTRLKHPNIATTFDFAFDDDGSAYLVMEFIDGLNLGDLIRVKGKLDVSSALEVARQVLSALDYLHRKLIIHRDISPENIMVSQDEDGPQVKLIDLGIAKALNDAGGETRVGVFIGKARYSSPEQLSPGEPLDGRSDLYSLGVVLYLLVTGQSPIRGKSMSQLLVAHLREPPMSFAESDPEGVVPDDARRVILKALEKDPDDRYASAAEFASAIEDLQRRYPPEMFAEDTRITTSRKLFIAPPPPVTAAEHADIDRHFNVRQFHVPAAPPPLHEQKERGEELASARMTPPPQPAGGFWTRWRAAGGIIGLAVAIVLALFLIRGFMPGESDPVTPAGGGMQGGARAGSADRAAAAAPSDASSHRTAAPLPPEVENARAEAVRSRTAADAVNASVRAAALYRQAAGRQQNGDLLATSNPLLATQAYSDAAAVFRAAADESRPRPEDSEAAKETHRMQDSSDAMAEARGAREPSSEQRRAADEKLVLDALRGFVGAQQTLDADAYVAVFPSADKAKVADAFSSLLTQSVSLKITTWRIAGSRADVSALEARTARPKKGTIRQTSTNRSFVLEKRASDWVITSVR